MEGETLANYLPVLILMVVAVLFTVGTLLLSHLIGPKSGSNPHKDTPYECGMTPQGSPRGRFSVKFYIVAMLFILFDVEGIFIILWSVLFRELRWFGVVEMMVFLAVLMVGFAYVWRKGALDWER